MRSLIKKQLVIIALTYSANSFALVNICVHGYPYAEGFLLDDVYTVYHYMDFDSLDYSLGWVEHYTSYSSTGFPSAGWYSDIVPITGIPFQLIWVSDPQEETYTLGGESSSGTMTGIPGEEGHGWEPLYSAPPCDPVEVTFEEPSVDAWLKDSAGNIIENEIVEVGEMVTLGFNVLSDILDDYCVYLGQIVGTSESIGPFPADLSHSGEYSVNCLNYFGQGTDAVDFHVVDCPSIPFSVLFMDYPTIEGANTQPFAQFDPFVPYVINEEAYCDDESWKMKVTTARQTLTIHINLNGYGEITSNDINSANCSLLAGMKQNVEHNASRITPPWQYWVSKEAIWAHEEVHKQRFTSSFQVKYGSFRSTVEDIDVPLSSASTPAGALSLLKATPEFIQAENDLSDDKALAVTFASGHLPELEFIAPQISAIQPIVSLIDSRLQSCP